MARGGFGLSIGGTGMLAEATRQLAARCETTLVVARHASRFAAGDPSMRALDADWTADGFHERIAAALDTFPRIDRALLWLHRLDHDLPVLLPRLEVARTVLVLGSSDGRPGLPPGASACATVRLGSIAARGGRRWLTHAEISAGALAALDDGQSRIVGELAGLD